MINTNTLDRDKFIELICSKKAKEILSKKKQLPYQVFQFPKLSSIFIRVYKTYYAVALISDSEHFIVKSEEYKDMNIGSNLLYYILKDNEIENQVEVKPKKRK